MLPVNGNACISGVAPEEGWFILANLDTLELALAKLLRPLRVSERECVSEGHRRQEARSL